MAVTVDHVLHSTRGVGLEDGNLTQTETLGACDRLLDMGTAARYVRGHSHTNPNPRVP